MRQVDTFSLGVSGLDWYALTGGAQGAQSISKFKLLRVVRVLRLVKLARLLRASRMLKRWETRIAVNYGVLQVLRIGFYTLVLAHWTACLWSLQTGAARMSGGRMRALRGVHTPCWPMGGTPFTLGGPLRVCFSLVVCVNVRSLSLCADTLCPRSPQSCATTSLTPGSSLTTTASCPSIARLIRRTSMRQAARRIGCACPPPTCTPRASIGRSRPPPRSAMVTSPPRTATRLSSGLPLSSCSPPLSGCAAPPLA